MYLSSTFFFVALYESGMRDQVVFCSFFLPSAVGMENTDWLRTVLNMINKSPLPILSQSASDFWSVILLLRDGWFKNLDTGSQICHKCRKGTACLLSKEFQSSFEISIAVIMLAWQALAITVECRAVNMLCFRWVAYRGLIDRLNKCVHSFGILRHFSASRHGLSKVA